MRSPGAIRGVSVLGILAGIAVPPLRAAEIVATVDVVSRYTWRGFTRADGWAVQPDLRLRNIAGQGLFLDAWGSIAIEKRDRQPVDDEVDLVAGIARKVGPVDATGAVTVYFFPSATSGARRTQEIWGTLQASVRVADLDLRPQLLAARDFGLYDASYLRLGIFPRLDFKQKLRLRPRIWAGFGDFPVPGGRRTFRFQAASLETDVEVRPWQYKDVAFALGPRLTRERVPVERWRFWVGAGVSYRKALP